MTNAVATHWFKVGLVLDFTFSLEELDQVLACSDTAAAAKRLLELLNQRTTSETNLSGYNVDEFLKAGAKAMLEHRKFCLKQLPENANAIPA